MGEELVTFTGYCVKCKERDVEVVDGEIKETANGRRMVQGTHEACGTKVSRFLPKEEAATA